MAYIDPGTGSLIIQALIAGLLGFLFSIRRWLKAVVRRFLGRGSQTSEETERE